MKRKDAIQMLRGLLATGIGALAIVAVIRISEDAPMQSKLPTFSTPEPQYVLRDRDGYLALYWYNSGVFQTVYSIRTDSLPAYDQETLQNGVYVADRAELNQLLEDYGS